MAGSTTDQKVEAEKGGDTETRRDFLLISTVSVGAVGAATHLPLDSANEIRPVGYLKINLGGSNYVIPYFNAS